MRRMAATPTILSPPREQPKRLELGARPRNATLREVVPAENGFQSAKELRITAA